jgi:hypothetical protein
VATLTQQVSSLDDDLTQHKKTASSAKPLEDVMLELQARLAPVRRISALLSLFHLKVSMNP